MLLFDRAIKSLAPALTLSLLIAPSPAQTPPVGSLQQPSPPSQTNARLLISMEEASQRAFRNNQQIRAQRLNVDQARANEITAALKPNPVFNSANEDFPFFSPNYLTLNNLRTNQEFSTSVTYLLERGGKRERRIDVARDTTDVTGKNVADLERQLRWQVVQSFTGALLAKSNLQLARADLEDFSNVVEINRRRLDAGDMSEGDFLKIQLQLLQFEQDVSTAEMALVQSKAALRQLLGFTEVPADYDVSGDLAHKPHELDLGELSRQALAERPDLQAATSGIKLADDTVSLAYANRARDLVNEAEYKRNGLLNTFGFGLSIEIPIHTRNQGEIARSKIAVQQAEETRAATQYAVLTDVMNAYSGFQTNSRILNLYESGYLDRATRSREIANYAYRRGAASLLDLLDAERSYRAVQLAYRQALSAYMLSVEQINFAVGKQVLQ
jgi:outer membrane protein, heavy metal efflux system